MLKRLLVTDRRASARLFCGLVALLAISLLALAGGAIRSDAASSPSVTAAIVVLNDESATIPGQPTAGGNIGYRITVTNGGTSAANHLSLTNSIGSTGTLSYVDAPAGVSCGATTPPTSQLSCRVTKLEQGASFTVTALFRTPAGAPAGTVVENQGFVAFDSQTNGPSNQKIIPLEVLPRTLAGAFGGSLAQSLALGGETLSAFGPGQTSGVTMPGAFRNGNAYVGAKLENATAPPLCAGCPGFVTTLTMPTASSFGTAGPFLDPAGTPAPFRWTLNLDGSLVPKGFRVASVFHDGAALPMCVVDSLGNPQPRTTAPGICVASLRQASNTKTITATGLALANGAYQFG